MSPATIAGTSKGPWHALRKWVADKDGGTEGTPGAVDTVVNGGRNHCHFSNEMVLIL